MICTYTSLSLQSNSDVIAAAACICALLAELSDKVVRFWAAVALGALRGLLEQRVATTPEGSPGFLYFASDYFAP